LKLTNIYSKPLFLVALEVELPAVNYPKLNIQYTGVGKVNATYSATKNITIFKPSIVINFGSAGALDLSVSGLVQVVKVFQRDMDVRDLGFKLGQTPFEEGNDALILKDYFFRKNDSILPKVSCSTGDNFVSSVPELESQIVDMELYALAKVCSLERIPLMSWKFISDNADVSSPDAWEKNVTRGAKVFEELVLAKILKEMD
jgi:adenosylhomocysteine nucleosidase